MFSSDDIEALFKALEPYAWVDHTPMLTLYPEGDIRGQHLELRMVVKLPIGLDYSGEDAVVRLALLANAEAILAQVKALNWSLLRMPRIDFSGEILYYLDGRPSQHLHECEVRIEIQRTP